MIRVNRRADTGPAFDVAPSKAKRFLQRLEYCIAMRHHLVGRGDPGQNHRKFIAADTRDRSLARQCLLQLPAEAPQKRVPGIVAKQVVHLLELSEVETQPPHPAALFKRPEKRNTK